MLPFTDIPFFLFAAIYVVMIWCCSVLFKGRFYREITCFVTAWYLLFYFKHTVFAFSFVFFSYAYIRFLHDRIGHRLVSAIVLAIPMVLLKLHVNPGFFYFAGLSFVTFRSIQVALDREKGERLSPAAYFNFLFFIPSFYIGPVDRFKRFTENSAVAFEKLKTDLPVNGLQEFLKGFLYKFIVAEFISRYWLLSAGIDARGIEVASDIYAYAFFLFFDFAGYSSMAIGMGNMLGIELPYNFKSPFIARNPADFWQRWHASLTHWLTDYFFKPFYKWLSSLKKLKSKPVLRQNTAIFFTFFLMGVWNGFEQNFVFSGLLYGLYSVVHNYYTIECRKHDRDVVFGNLNEKKVHYISVFIMFNLVCFALYIFSGRYERW
jgi:membrane protein involved in D-alanine export